MEETRNQRIKRVLKEKEINQDVLADVLKKTRASINERLNSEKQIDSFEFLQAVSNLTHISIHYLYYGIGELDNVSEAEVKELMVREENRHEYIAASNFAAKTMEMGELKEENKKLKNTLDQIVELIGTVRPVKAVGVSKELGKVSDMLTKHDENAKAMFKTPKEKKNPLK